MRLLYPSRFARNFYVLDSLRRALTRTAETHVTALGGRRVLVDFGAGSGPYRMMLEKYVEQYVAVDLPGTPCVDVHTDADGRVPLPDGSATIVLSTQVLEHVPSPQDYLAECRRLLRRGGLLVLSTHGYWMYHPHPLDLWRWTADGLKKLLEDSGFRIVEISGIIGLAATAVQLLQDALWARVPIRSLRGVFAFVMQNLAMLLDRFSSPSARDKDACVFLAVAERV